ncbi:MULTISPECIES: LysE family translocator [Cysteiniphilum]|uniref:Threonine export protein RhtC n=1 Tax=Cysteiniphilum litorale TaxID=2056700 RepID=A0A8J2Z5N7_9GAMM|nr:MULTISPECIES: LysE family translocator [Cysteiniphilum]GGG01534.1 threonine export protein RhtC [Cysteiniphilum litorale]
MLIAALLSLLLLQLLGLMLPGPDFFMVLRSSIRYGRNPAVLVALGIATGVVFYATLVVLLLDYLSDNFLIIVHWIALFGGCYLLYIAYNCFKASKGKHSLEANVSEVVKISKRHLWLTGFLCNLSNPKVIVFFVSLLPLFVLKSSALWYHLSILVVMFLSTWIWFSFVAYVMGSERVRNVFVKHMAKLEIIFSVILTIFALLLIYSFVESVIL